MLSWYPGWFGLESRLHLCLVFRCVRQERISIRGSVRPSVRRSVRPLRLCKNRVSWLFLAAMRSYTKSYERQTCFESLLYYSCRLICLIIHLSLHICHLINTHRDTVRTHHCPVGLVFLLPSDVNPQRLCCLRQ